MSDVRVLIQEGKCLVKSEVSYVTTVHGMDSLESGGEKKLNHESMCRFISSRCENMILKTELVWVVDSLNLPSTDIKKVRSCFRIIYKPHS